MSKWISASLFSTKLNHHRSKRLKTDLDILFIDKNLFPSDVVCINMYVRISANQIQKKKKKKKVKREQSDSSYHNRLHSAKKKEKKNNR